MTILFDLDQTLVNTNVALDLRKKRQWATVYRLIPQMTIYPHIYEIIQLVNDKGIKFALVSASPKKYCQMVLSHFDLKFEIIVGYHDTVKHKPHPDPYLKAIELLQEKNGNIYAIGDDVIDVLAAKNAGIKSIGCSWGAYNCKGLKAANPDLLFGSPQDLLMFLQKKLDKL